MDLARELYGTAGANEAPRNSQAVRRWLVGELPIPNEEAAGYLAQVLDVSMARLLEPKGKFNPVPDMIRPRSDSKRFPSGLPSKKKKNAKGSGRTPRAYNAAYRAKQKAEKAAGTVKRKYTKHAKTNGAEASGWKLAEGIQPPDYTIRSHDAPPGHLIVELKATLPHERAMAIVHMLQHNGAGQEG